MAEAARLMEEQRYAEAGAAWEAVVRSDPSHAAIAAMQVGATHYFAANYPLAIQWYEYARGLGHDPADVTEHVLEAQLATRAHASEVQFTQVEGQWFINRRGAGWQPYVRPPTGGTVMKEDGSFWKLEDGRWDVASQVVIDVAAASREFGFVALRYKPLHNRDGLRLRARLRWVRDVSCSWQPCVLASLCAHRCGHDRLPWW